MSMDSNARGVAEVLPCPWCGSAAEVYRAAGYGFVVECSSETCVVGPTLSVTRGRANAITAWNTRANSHDALQAENKVLREALEMAIRFIDPSQDPMRFTHGEMVAQLRQALRGEG